MMRLNDRNHDMFENAEISIDELPRIDSVDWLGMDPSFARRQLTEAAIGFIFTLIGIGALQTIFGVAFADEGPNINFGWLWLVPVLVGIPIFSWPLISVPKKGYAIRDKDIVYKSGVFWQTVTAVPFNRIQHVEKSSTPLDRRFNIATLQLFTAGGSGGDLKIHGLSAKTAEELRTFILNKVGSSVEQH
jgi:membrane protein YdbS with pleckstrin-like domain